MKRLEADLDNYRALLLAHINLTRRDDLAVTQPANGSREEGPDLIVSIGKKGQGTGRSFGVVTRAVASPDQLPDGSRRKRRELKLLSFDRNPAHMPACLFVFEMKSDQGLYGWLVEPVIGPGGTAELREHAPDSFAPLDNEAVDAIVNQVDRWYDTGGVDITAARLVAGARENPRAILLALGTQLEREVVARLQEAGVMPARDSLPLPELVRLGVKEGVFVSAMLEPVETFWRLRDQVAHEAPAEVSASTLQMMVLIGAELVNMLAPVQLSRQPRSA